MKTQFMQRQVAVGFVVGLMAVGIPLSAPQAQQLSPLEQGKAMYYGPLRRVPWI